MPQSPTLHRNGFFSGQVVTTSSYDSSHYHYGCSSADFNEQLRRERDWQERLANQRLAHQERMAFDEKMTTLKSQLTKAVSAIREHFYQAEGEAPFAEKLASLLDSLEAENAVSIPAFGTPDTTKIRDALQHVYQEQIKFYQFRINMTEKVHLLTKTPIAPMPDYRQRFTAHHSDEKAPLVLNRCLLGFLTGLTITSVAMITVGLNAAATSSLSIMPPIAGFALFVIGIIALAHIVDAYSDKNIAQKTLDFKREQHRIGEKLAHECHDFVASFKEDKGFPLEGVSPVTDGHTLT